ncbi:glycosyltransferase [Acuticoccus mangrovi]|uniref:Glycosyltransferase n=1 Tax=Acuticoccus mangrovi TaxID=2796142 RepID=A0A934IUE5_9HYPH|nr:glycosyltransferase [Acuticoccus mangrovi]
MLVIPTGIFLPAFYEGALDVIRKTRARVCLLNFEAGNWFNTYAPVRRDLRLWDYWRRMVEGGGLVLSSARESQKHAQTFYEATQGSLRFEVVSPPINSLAADSVGAPAKDGSIVAFLRSSDVHKGGADLLDMDPALFKGRTLRLISGGGVEDRFLTALKAHLAPEGATVALHSAVSDRVKFDLLARADALIFPSRFEGFGYPPVEAAYVGTEIVGYDLPVIQETVGDVAYLAPRGETSALGEALRQALQSPHTRQELRAAVEKRVAFPEVALRFEDVLLRSYAALEPAAFPAHRIQWGPWEGVATDPNRYSKHRALPVMRVCRWTRAKDLLIQLEVVTPAPIAGIVVNGDPDLAQGVFLQPLEASGGARATTRATFSLPGTLFGRHLELAMTDASGKIQDVVFLQIDEAADVSDEIHLNMAMEGDGSPGVVLRLQGAAKDIDTLYIYDPSDGTFVASPRRANGDFLFESTTDPKADYFWYIYLFAGDTVVSKACGVPPMEEGRWLVQRQTSSVYPRLKLTNEKWCNGVYRYPVGDCFGVLGFPRSAQGRLPGKGALVRLGDEVLIVEREETIDKFPTLLFKKAINPFRISWTDPLELLSSAGQKGEIFPLARPGWASGVFRDPMSATRCAILVGAKVEIYPGDTLVFENGTRRDVIAVIDCARWNIVWLAGTLTTPWMSPAFEVVPNAMGPIRWFEAHRHESAVEGPCTTISVSHQDGPFAPGQMVVTEEGDARCILAVNAEGDTDRIDLDAALSGFSGAGGKICLRHTTEREAAEWIGTTNVVPRTVSVPSNGLFQSAMDLCFSRTAMPMVPTQRADRPRILCASIVPPFPANQGNRVVTKNLISHLVNMGFDVDLVLMGNVKSAEVAAEYGDRVRIYQSPFPNWEKDPVVQQRKDILARIRDDGTAGDNLMQDTVRSLNIYDPFFIATSSVVNIAKKLFKTYKYDGIVCNYTHMARVAVELSAIAPLPPVAIITHDALSRLPDTIVGKGVDLMYRYCTVEMERDVLNRIEGAVIVAISQSEVDYFTSIGVTNRIVLSEFDAYAELYPFRIMASAFRSKQVVFHASGNVMNVAAIYWFLENCWGAIRSAVPNAELVICGRICREIPSVPQGVRLEGEVSRGDLLKILSGATLSINPTLAGTGLKIKTVEAVCLGLPSVCLPAAVEGLEEIVERIGIVADDANAFQEACISLLSDQSRWQSVHQSALDVALERFSEGPVYRGLDEAMGWEGVAERTAAPRMRYAREGEEAAEPDAAGPVIELVRGLERAGVSKGLGGVILSGCSAQAMWSRTDQHQAIAAALEEELPAWALIQAMQLVGSDPEDAQAWSYVIQALRMIPNEGHSVHAAVEAKKLALPLGNISEWASVADEPVYPLTTTELLAPSDLTTIGDHFGFGWGAVEAWGGVWIEGRYARLWAAVEPGCTNLGLRLAATQGGTDDEQSVDIRVDGVHVGRHDILRDRRRRMVWLPLEAREEASLRLIEFEVQDPSPLRSNAGIISNIRPLGISLSGLRLRRDVSVPATTAA